MQSPAQLSALPSARFGFNPLSANCRSAQSRYGQVTHQGYGLVGPAQQRANMAAYFAAVRAGQVCMCGSSVRSCPIPGWAH